MTKPYKMVRVESIPPRGGKSFMMEAQKKFYQQLGEAYNRAYQMMFDEIRGKDEGFYSDEEIHKFIEENISFAVEISEGSFREFPKIFIVPKWKPIDRE